MAASDGFPVTLTVTLMATDRSRGDTNAPPVRGTIALPDGSVTFFDGLLDLLAAVEAIASSLKSPDAVTSSGGHDEG